MSGWRVRIGVALVVTLPWTGAGDVTSSAQGRPDVTPPSAAAAEARVQGTGSLRGRVIDGATGQPLRGATISAYRLRARSGDMHFSAVTNTQGVFTVEGLPDGAYTVSTFTQGYYESPAARGPVMRELTLTGGGTIDLGDIRLMRGGAITGRVTDTHGEPVVGARVAAVGRPRGGDVLVSMGGTAITDDRGSYRLHGLMPGKYTVRAVPTGPSARGPVRLQGDEPEELPAFATATTEPSAAEFVDVRMSADAVLDVRLPAGRVAEVSGRLSFEGEPPTNLRPNVSLRPADDGVQLNYAWARAEVDGRFTFLDVAPGRYRVVADEPTVIAEDGRARQRAGWLDVVVTGEPVTDLVVPVGFGATVRGRVEIDGGDPTAMDGRPLRVVLQMLPGWVGGGSLMVSTTSDLTFEVRDVLGPRHLDVGGLPPGWWLKSVLIDGEDVTDRHTFPVTGVVEGVVLLVSGRESGVSGRVQGPGGLLQGASVIVLPQGRTASMQAAPATRQIASVAIDGRFTAPALRPGRYTALALSPAMRSVYDRLDHDEREALIAARGRLVDVVDGRLTDVTLQLIER